MQSRIVRVTRRTDVPWPSGGGAVILGRTTSIPALIPPEMETALQLYAILANRLRREDGQGLAEYALILALIAVVAILALVFLGGKISGILSTIGENL